MVDIETIIGLCTVRYWTVFRYIEGTTPKIDLFQFLRMANREFTNSLWPARLLTGDTIFLGYQSLNNLLRTLDSPDYPTSRLPFSQLTLPVSTMYITLRRMLLWKIVVESIFFWSHSFRMSTNSRMGIKWILQVHKGFDHDRKLYSFSQKKGFGYSNFSIYPCNLTVVWICDSTYSLLYYAALLMATTETDQG